MYLEVLGDNLTVSFKKLNTLTSESDALISESILNFKPIVYLNAALIS
jgi:hypothetical protein